MKKLLNIYDRFERKMTIGKDNGQGRIQLNESVFFFRAFMISLSLTIIELIFFGPVFLLTFILIASLIYTFFAWGKCVSKSESAVPFIEHTDALGFFFGIPLALIGSVILTFLIEVFFEEGFKTGFIYLGLGVLAIGILILNDMLNARKKAKAKKNSSLSG